MCSFSFYSEGPGPISWAGGWNLNTVGGGKLLTFRTWGDVEPHAWTTCTPDDEDTLVAETARTIWNSGPDVPAAAVRAVAGPDDNVDYAEEQEEDEEDDGASSTVTFGDQTFARKVVTYLLEMGGGGAR